MSSKDQTVHDEQVSKPNEIKTLQENETTKKQEQAVESEQPVASSSIAYDEKVSNDLRISELETQLLESQKREREALLRAKAEVENIRRRTEQDIEKAHKFALERFANELLPVIDNLERAIELIDREKTESMSMLEGLELTLKSFLSTISKYGIEVVSEKNVPFNPELHQAMTMVQSEGHEPNQVIDVMQKGYTLHGRLLRPAMVIVSKKEPIKEKK